MSVLPPLRFTGATILCDGVLQRRSLSVENGRIARGPFPAVDLTGYLLLPGIVDLHGDAFERHIAPRPRAPFPIRAGLSSAARDAAAHGVTTAWFAQCWSWEGGLRGPDYAETLLAEAADYAPRAPIDIRIQIRCEIHMIDSRDRLLSAIRRHGVDYVVFNNHLPEAIEIARREPGEFAGWAKRGGRTSEEFIRVLRAAKDRQGEVPRHLCTLAEAFDTLGVTYGSHDDPDAETREEFRLLGAHVAEFPLSERAAAAAKAMNDPVLLGAPNVVRDGSQAGNVSARRLVERGLCDALVSDYHYPALPAAAWALVDQGLKTLPEAWAMISTRPARIMGLSDRGTLGTGKRADLVIVNAESREIEATLSHGRFAYLAGGVAQRLARAGRDLALAAE
ncbi:alpha-D-ribose 1-methylphosphonate 5-triphosphate diphosphatase [Celeribacter indicus]|uniref:Phosphonate metabolism protein PhnM n=1 Tax=Celeribacter indicus TaxID=1208324 RepID=A0A0B5DXP8_9RHOB|nr:alpha-D-ribose 1-methylphosphonate 5-triphosphate diphosphatase [Celeribacter indicus]AJE45521.1 phosphonate metabolism protein PhnM [Celeribacter indicus]SDW86898.1 alpha-D-ribose 1-methylphosphonate 5-triphosphate diphosphatase [Celeribacter indicus]